jgi:hypothetical protein
MKLSLLTLLIFCSISLAAQNGKNEFLLSHRVWGKNRSNFTNENLKLGASLSYFRHTGKFTSVGVRSSYSNIGDEGFLGGSRSYENAGTLDLLFRLSTHKDRKLVLNVMVGTSVQITRILRRNNDFCDCVFPLPLPSVLNYDYHFFSGAAMGMNLAVNIIPKFTFGIEANNDIYLARQDYEPLKRTFSLGTFVAYRW